MDLESFCRLCLNENRTVLNVFSEGLVHADMHAKIEKYLYLDVRRYRLILRENNNRLLFVFADKVNR